MALDAYWGVDSANTANHKVGVAGHPTLFEYVTDHCGMAPEFWGRYVGGKFSVTKAEADFIFKESDGKCRILVIYNGATNSTSSLQGGYNAGVHDAQKAIAGADAAGVPAGVMIYADIEPGWKTTSEWFKGWWDGMFRSKYAGMGGVYENPLPWNAPNFSTPYINALKGDSAFIFQDPPAKYRFLYSQQPQKGCVKPGDIKFGFHPAEPTGLAGVTVLWQYAIDCLKVGGSKWGLVDMDLADEQGYALMWSRNQGDGTGILV